MARKRTKKRASARDTTGAPRRGVAASGPGCRSDRRRREPVRGRGRSSVGARGGGLVAVAEEQRASPRVAVAVEIIFASDSQFFSGLSGDISEGGLFLSTYRALPIGSAVDLEFSLPGSDAPLHARGVVRWLREHSTGQPRGVGIAFDALGDEDRERIHRFCSMRPPLYYEGVLTRLAPRVTRATLRRIMIAVP